MAQALWKTFFGASDPEEDLRGPTNLSEDACNDLVKSLVQLGLIPNISTSLDGKAFITHEKLTEEILLELELRNANNPKPNDAGRVSLLDLPKAINANFNDIQERVMDIIRTRPGTIVHVHDELFTRGFLDQMTEQLNKELREKGFLITTELCRKYKLGIDFMRQFLKERIGFTIDGRWDTVDRNLVYAPWFMEQEKSALYQKLSGLEEYVSTNYTQRPTALSVLRSRLCELLSKEKDLPGMFKGTGEQGVFVPSPYEQQQTEWIETFFKDNGFIEYDLLRKRGITDPKAYVNTNHPTALLLDTYVVKESIWSVVDATVEDAIANLSWIDVKPLVPSPLTSGDIASLLRQLPSFKDPAAHIQVAPEQDHSITGFGGGYPQESFIIRDTFVLTSGQIQKCMLKMGPFLDKKIKAVVSWRLSFGGDPELDDEGGQGDMTAISISLHEHLFGSSPVYRKDKSSKSSKNGPTTGKGSNKKKLQDFMALKDIENEIKIIEPDFDPEMVKAVSRALYRELLQNLRDRNRTVILNEAEEAVEEAVDTTNNAPQIDPSAQIIVSQLFALWRRVRLFSKGIDVFDDQSVKNSLSKHLLQSLCIELVDYTILAYVFNYAGPLNDGASDSAPSDKTQEVKGRVGKALDDIRAQMPAPKNLHQTLAIPANDMILLLELCPADSQESLAKMRKITTGSGKHKNLCEFLSLQENRIKTLQPEGENCNDLQGDSLVLREHLEGLRHVLSEIAPQSDNALMLHIVTMIAFQHLTGTMLHASGKYVPRIQRQLRTMLETPSKAAPQTEHNSSKEMGLSQLEILEKMLGLVLSSVRQDQATESSEDDNARDTSQFWMDVFGLGMTLSSP
ncbi:E3 UFM1-protein ligase 1 [Lunasporangiospora selenospora]|uniref:E3 UFM1-protein ligase 1 n=1 Tax=Lunasporangiospora selenospora TaxID=979761 RepID=A0A9P6KHQ2_9FUNG|nr:E3 UFM1-protein ligase 1 [Lunasporangiospora selenospora]